jgi:hypothetical protein
MQQYQNAGMKLGIIKSSAKRTDLTGIHSGKKVNRYYTIGPGVVINKPFDFI